MYAAREIAALERFGGVGVTVVGSRPPFPTAEIDRACPFPIRWCDGAASPPAWRELAGRTPDIVFSSGWAFPLCNRLASAAKAEGCKVVCMADNRLRWTARQLLGAVRFRLGLRRRFDGFFVPGSQGRSLMRLFGVPDRHVREGLYGADKALFRMAAPPSRRPRTILFVGQMIRRKGVDLLLDGFRDSGLASRGWRLVCIGDGPLAAEAASVPGCAHLPFCDSEEVARHLAEARVFILPSRNDNWGVALHEAALSGCLLAASSGVGAAAELLPGGSPLLFSPGSRSAIRDCLAYVGHLDDAAIDAHAAASLNRAHEFGPDRFAREVAGFVEDMLGVRLAAELPGGCIGVDDPFCRTVE